MQRLFPVPLKTVLMMFVGTVTLFLVNCGDDSPGGGTPGGGLPGGGGDAGVYAGGGPLSSTSFRGGPGDAFTIYHPTPMNGRLPVMVWANGTGTPTRTYERLFKHMATHGIITVAANTTQAMFTNDLQRGAEWIRGEAGRSGSPFNGKVDPDAIGVAGHSQGGAAAIAAGANRIFKTSVLLAPGPFHNAARLTGPSLFVAGSRDVIVNPGWVQNHYNAAPNPKMYAELSGATHNSFSGNFNGSRGYITAWFKAHLAGDSNARALFYGGGCVMCSDPTYETRRAGL